MHALQKVEKTATANRKVSDADLERDLKVAFTKAKDLKIDELKVSVKDGKATLKGSVDSEKSVQRATAIAERIQALHGVDNRIAAKSSKGDCCADGQGEKSASRARNSTDDPATLTTM